MAIDRFGRIINYLRISLTDHCNLRCVYCMPEDMIFRPNAELMQDDEILLLTDLFASLGFHKIRLTGGEPTVRANIVHLVREIKHTPGVRSLSMTTNGLLLNQLAAPLAEAGLDPTFVIGGRLVSADGRALPLKRGPRAATVSPRKATVATPRRPVPSAEAPVKARLEAIQRAARHASDLSGQMLAYSGKGQFVIERIDLNLLVEEMGHLLKQHLQSTLETEVLFLHGGQRRVGVGGPDHPELVGVHPELIFQLQAHPQCGAGVLTGQHVVGLGLGYIKITDIPGFIIRKFIIR